MSDEEPFEVRMVPIGDLVAHESNPQIGDVGAVATAIAVDGWHLACLAQAPTKTRRKPRIIAGHTRWRALAALQSNGWDSPEGEHLTYEQLAAKVPLPPIGFVPVQMQRMDDTRALRKLISDNRASALASTDDAVLVELLQELATNEELFGSLFEGDDIDTLLAELNAHPFGAHGADDAPARPENPITQIGDTWLLGAHRVLCGDSTDADDVRRLMDGAEADLVFTDPPYGVGYTGGAKEREALAGDELGSTIYADALPHLRFAAADHAALYLWYADAHAAAAAAAAAAAGYLVSAQIIWVKNNAQFVTSAHYKGKHEICFYAHRKGKTARWVGPNNEVTVWEIDRANKNEYHPTQKPVELVERAIGNSSNRGDLVLDLFGGSGSTLIACEQVGRRNATMEIDPGYCDVIVGRWESLTGKKAERHPASG